MIYGVISIFFTGLGLLAAYDRYRQMRRDQVLDSIGVNLKGIHEICDRINGK